MGATMTIAYDPHAEQDDTAHRGAAAERTATVAVGLLALVGRRVGRDDDSLALAVGFAAQAVRRVHEAAATAQPHITAVAGQIERLPLLGTPARRGRNALAKAIAGARARGRTMLAQDRIVAERFVRANVDDAVAWARVHVVPQVVTDVTAMLPGIIDRALPEIRARVLPVLIDDLTNDPRIRQLVVEQSRGVLGEAQEHLHTTTTHADDRVESAARRFIGRAER